jgi:DNA (cytosine-5)-methyltransferase 1
MDELAIHSISLFSGVGMLDEGLHAGFAHMGITYRTVCHVEREAYAAAVLAARMQEGSLDEAPIWADVCTFDATAWHGKVDCIVAGFPCQDISVAGKRKGLDGERSGLFFEIPRIADDCGAWFLFLENVAGIATATATVMDEAEGELEERAAARVVGELADLGWNAEWIVVSAADVGASHGRARWFCLAWRNVADAAWHGWNRIENREARSRRGICETGDMLGDTSCIYEQERKPDGAHQVERESWRRFDEPVYPVADASSAGLQGCEQVGSFKERHRSSTSRPATQLCDTHLFAPSPNDPRWSAIIRQWQEVSPALEPTFCSMVNGLAFDMGDSRAARLKCIGNGVVALCAAAAFVVLARRAFAHHE